MMKLAQALRRMRKEEKGFTLIELMVVVVIIGILAAVAVPKITGAVNDSKVKADIASGKVLQDALDRYMTTQDNGAAPPTVGELKTALVDGGFIAALPTAQQDKKGLPDSTAIIYDGTNGTFTVYDISADPDKEVWPAPSI